MTEEEKMEPTREELDAQTAVDEPGPPNNPVVDVEVADQRQRTLVFYSPSGQVITVDLMPDVLRISCDCPAGMTRFLMSTQQFDSIAALRAIVR
jgi:hypothetical protein